MDSTTLSATDGTHDLDLETGGLGHLPEKELEEKRLEDVDDVVWVDWDGPDDPNNPLNWSTRSRWAITWVGLGFAAVVSGNMSAYAIGQGSIQKDLHTTQTLTILGITFFTATFGIAPLIIAPLSEIYGRSYMYFTSAVIFTILLIPQALAQNIETILICRFLSGIAACASINITGGILADIWTNAERGLPMALFSLATFAMTALAPVMFGIVEQTHGFRLIFWILFAQSGLFTVILIFFVRETRAPVLLSRKAARLRKETGSQRYRARSDLERASLRVMLYHSLTRPIQMLIFEPVIIAFSLYAAVAWAAIYILLESVAFVFGGVYGFDIAESGYVFASEFIFCFVGLGMDFLLNKLYDRTVAKRGPEARLYHAMLGGLILPIGGWIYAFGSRSSVHWIVPAIGIGLLYCGAYLVYITTFSYVADFYTFYASSALAAQSCIRNTVACVAPLYTNQLYNKAGVAGGGSFVAGLSTLLAIVPFAVFHYGPRLRASSRFGKAALEESERTIT